MRAHASRVLMLGTDPAGRGGVAALVTVLRSAGLFERAGVRYVATHRAGSLAVRLAAAAGGFWRVAGSLLRRRRRPAIVHAHVASHGSFVRKSLLLWLARCVGCQTIFHLHGGGFRQFAGADAGVLMRRWIIHTLKRSARVVALTDGWADFLQALAPGARVLVVPNGVLLPDAPGLEAEGERILFLGRLEAAKGVPELLAAVALLAPRFPALRLVLAGSGEQRQWRQAASAAGIGGRVELAGWLDARARALQLARANVVCLPSHGEGLPMALLEAMAAGKAVVASAVGGIPELVTSGRDGLLTAPGAVPELAAALARVLGDAQLQQALGAQARARVGRQYGAEAVCAQWMAIYNDLAGTR